MAVVAQAGRLVWPALEALEGQAVLAALTALQVAAGLVVVLVVLEGRGLHLPTPYLAAVGLCPCPPVARPCLAQLPLAVLAQLAAVGLPLGVARRLAAQQQHPLSQQPLLQHREPKKFSKPPTRQSTK